jgi:hypothetical protein
MKTTLEIPDEIFRQAKKTRSLGRLVPLERFSSEPDAGFAGGGDVLC